MEHTSRILMAAAAACCALAFASCCGSGPKCGCGDAIAGSDVADATETTAPGDLSVDGAGEDAGPACVAESCNGVDDDCDGLTDEDDSEGCTTYFADADADGFGADGDSRCLCVPEGAYTAKDGGDCDDSDAQVGPGGVETWDGKDQDCDGVADDGLDVLVVEGDGTAHHPSLALVPGEDAVHVGWVEGQHTYLWGKSYHLGKLSAGGTLEKLFDEGQDTFLYHSDSHLAHGPGAVLNAVFHVSGTMGEEMAYASVGADGVAGPATQLTVMDGPNTDLPHLVVDDGGGIHTVWASDHAGVGISNLYYRKFERNPADGAVVPVIGDESGVPLTASTTEHPQRRFDMIRGPDGNLVLVYVDGESLALMVLDPATGQTGIGPLEVTPAGQDTPMLFLTPDGTLHLALVIGGVAHYAHLGLDGTVLLGPVPVSGPDAAAPGVLVSSDGIAVTFWVAYAQSGVREVFMRRVDPATGLPLDLPRTLTPDDGTSSRILRAYYSLAADENGGMHAVWWDTASDGAQSVHYTRFLP